MVTSIPFTVQDLIDGADLGLRLVAGAAGHEARVRGIHCVDVEHASQWLESGWVMLTTGLTCAADPQVQTELIRSLADVGCAGLGYGLGVVTDEVPPGLLDAADKHGLALFTVPPHIAFRQVTRYVTDQIYALNGPAVQRLASIERILLAAITETDGVSALLTRMSTVLGCEVALLRHGVVEVQTGRMPVRGVVGRHAGAAGRFDVDGWHGMALEVGAPGEDSLLVLGVPSGARLPDLLEAVGQSCVGIVRMACRLGEVAASQRSAALRAALSDLLTATERSQAGTAMRQLQELGFSGMRYAVVYAEGADVERSVAAVNDTPGRPVAVPWGSGVAILVPGMPSESELADRLRAWQLAPEAAVGRAVSAPEQVRGSLADAMVVWRAAGTGPGISRYEDLSLPDLLLAELPTDRFSDRVADWMRPLEEHPLLLTTALVYLDANYNVNQTATILGIHPNSVRYRLRRVEELLESDLRSPAVLLALFVAAKSTLGTGQGAAILSMEPRGRTWVPDELAVG